MEIEISENALTGFNEKAKDKLKKSTNEFISDLIEEAIQARNLAVHSGNIIPNDIIVKYSEQIDKVISKLLSK